MKYIESSSHLEVWIYDFIAKTVFTGILATYSSTLTLEDVGDPKYELIFKIMPFSKLNWLNEWDSGLKI